MLASLAQFHENIERARDLSAHAAALPAAGAGAVPVDTSDIHRAAIVLGVSALDFFVHDVVRIGIVKAYSGVFPATEANLAFKVSLANVHQCLADPTDNGWLNEAVRTAHSFLTFQHPDRIADAIRMISPVKLWESVAKELGSNAKSVKTNLIAIVDRRNRIAHEADMDHMVPGARWPIDHAMVNDALNFLHAVATAISEVAEEDRPPAVPPPPPRP